MSKYCAAADVQVYLGTILLQANSQPTLAQVEQMCTDVSENIIDPVLRMYVDLPVTDEGGLKFLKQWATTCVLTKIYRAIETQLELADEYANECRDYLNRFKENPGLVVSPPPGVIGGEVSKGSTRPEPLWKKNEEQW